jgi:hypothetical protein
MSIAFRSPVSVPSSLLVEISEDKWFGLHGSGFFNDGDRSGPARTCPFDFYRETTDRKPVWPPNGRKIGHLLHVAIADLYASKMGLPNHLRITRFLEFPGQER